jgi:putative transposase
VNPSLTVKVRFHARTVHLDRPFAGDPGCDTEAFHPSVLSPRPGERKHRLLYSPRKRPRSGPKGTSRELIGAVIEIKRRNPRFGCRKIAEQISRAFAVEINKDVVRRILIQHYRPVPGGDGPSWLTVIGHAKDSLWSVDLFRCESILLKSH